MDKWTLLPDSLEIPPPAIAGHRVNVVPRGGAHHVEEEVEPRLDPVLLHRRRHRVAESRFGQRLGSGSVKAC